VVRDVFAAYDVMPFDLRLETFTDFAMTAFRGRLSKLEATRHMKLHELIRSDIDRTRRRAWRGAVHGVVQEAARGRI
jgi:hypothetical protein